MNKTKAGISAFTMLRRKTPFVRCTVAALVNAALINTVIVAPVFASPQGGQVVAGQGDIQQPDSATTVVNQSTQSMAVNWDSFNLSSGESVTFVQPSASATVLNRINDQNPSQIFGTIDANGHVFLLNTNGIVFGESASVNVGSLVASGLNISTEDFMNGNYHFQAQDGQEGGLIVNRGVIQAAIGGSASLIGGAVNNEGVIVAHLGQINLGAGRTATIDFDGDGLMRFQVDGEVVKNTEDLKSLVNNSGELISDGGQVLLTGKAARDVFTHTINNDGVIRATRIDKTGGVVRLLGNDTVVHSGQIDVSGQGADSTGGTVQILGNKVGLFDNASIDASGDAGGGTVLIGGDFQGKNSELQNASRTYVSRNATVNANANDSGDGGKVIVWADEVTRYYGSISAQGGAQSGDGGFVEVSGKQALNYDGNVDTTAVNGSVGNLLLDPDIITIDNTGTDDTQLDDQSIAFADGGTGTFSISAGKIVAQLETAQVTLQANNNIDVTVAVDASGNTNSNVLEMDADTINFSDGANITTNNANLVLGNTLAGNVVLADGATVSLGTDTGAGNIDINGTVTGGTGANLSLNTGTGTATFQNTVNLAGILTASGGNVDTNGQSITAGGLTVSGGTFNSGASGGAWDINGGINVSAGTLIATSDTLSVAGNWNKTGGLFTSNGGTVSFDGGGTQILNSGGITASDDFNNVAVANNSTIQLNTNAAVINGTLNVNTGGTFDLSGRNMTLDTLSNSGTLQLQGNETVTIATMDTNSGLVKYVGDGVGGISAFLLTDFGSTDYFNLEIAGDASENFQLQSTTNVANSLSIAAGNTLDLKGQNFSANTLSNLGTLELQGDETVAITNMDTDSGLVRYTGDGAGVTDIFSIIDFGTNDYFDLEIAGDASETFQLQNTTSVVGTLSIKNNNTLDLNGETFTLNVLSNLGTLELQGNETVVISTMDTNSGTVRYTGDGPGQLFDFALFDSVGIDYFNLEIAGDSSETFRISNAIDVAGNITVLSGNVDTFGQDITSGNLTVSGGIFNSTNSGGSWDINGDVNVSSTGELVATTGTMAIAGNWNKTGGTFTSNGGTVSFDSGGTQTLNSGGATVNDDFDNVAVTNNSTVQLINSAAVVNGSINIGTGSTFELAGRDMTLNTLSNSGTLQLQGNEVVSITTMDTDSGLVRYVGDGAVGIDAFSLLNNGYFDLEIAGDFSETFQLSGATTVAGTLTAAGGNVDTIGQNLTAGELTVTAGTFNSGAFTTGSWDINGDVNLSGGTLVATSGSMSVAGNWNKTGGTFTDNGGTVNFDGGGAQTVNSGGITTNDDFQNIMVTNNSTLQLQSALDVNGTIGVLVGTVDTNGQDITAGGLTVSDGTFNVANSGGTWDINGDVNLSAGTLVATSGSMTVAGNWNKSGGTFDDNSGTVTFDGSGTQALNSGGATSDDDFQNVNITNNTTVQLQNALVVNGTLATLSGSVNTGGQDITAGTLTVSGGTFNSTNSSGIWDISGDVNLSAGTLIATSGTLSVGGNWNKSGGVFSDNGGTVNFDGGVVQSLSSGGTTAGDDFQNLTISNNSTLQLQEAVDINGDVFISSGTFDTGADNAVHVAGNWSNNGAFTVNNSTVTFDGSGTQTIASGGSSFFDVSVSKSGGSVIFSDSLNVTNGLTTANGAYNVELQGRNNQIAGDTNFLNSGSVTLGNDSADSTTFTGGLATAGNLSNPGSTSIAGSVNTDNQQINLGGVSLSSNVAINSGGGDLNIASVSGGNNELILDAGNGNIALSSSATQLTSLSASANTISVNAVTTSGNQSYTASEIDFNGALSGGGSLTMQTNSAAQAIVVGGSANNTSALELTATELNQLNDGFSAITISGGSNINIQSGNFSDPISINSRTGNISVTGQLVGTDNADISLQAVGITLSTVTDSITTPGNVSLMASNGDINFGNNSPNTFGNINSTDGAVSLTVEGANSIVNNNGEYEKNYANVIEITANTLEVNLGSSGSFGTFASPIDVNISESSTFNAGQSRVWFNGDAGNVNIVSQAFLKSALKRSSFNKPLEIIDPGLFLTEINLFSTEGSGQKLPAEQTEEK